MVYPDAGHQTALERPAEVTATIRDHVAATRLGADATTAMAEARTSEPGGPENDPAEERVRATRSSGARVS